MFLSFIDETYEPEKSSFYKDWKRFGEIIFTREDVMKLVNKGEFEKRCVQLVLSFMGYYITTDIEDDLKRIEEEREEIYFDPDTFCLHLFNSIDLKRTGTIDIEELEGIFYIYINLIPLVMMRDMNLFNELSDQETQAKELFKQIDLNQNGKIELNEFQNWWCNRVKV